MNDSWDVDLVEGQPNMSDGSKVSKESDLETVEDSVEIWDQSRPSTFGFGFEFDDAIETMHDHHKETTVLADARKIDEISRFFRSIVFQVKNYNFFPARAWKNESVTFLDMRADHFDGKGKKRARFEYKLWNALQITRQSPDLYRYVGVIWLSERVIQVNRRLFGDLLRLEKCTSALFNAQGSLPTHGFHELSIKDIQVIGIRTYDDPKDCRFFYRPDGLFRFGSNENDIKGCKYTKPA